MIKPPRPDHLYFCTLDDFVVWPPLLKKRRGNFYTQNSSGWPLCSAPYTPPPALYTLHPVQSSVIPKVNECFYHGFRIIRMDPVSGIPDYLNLRCRKNL